jgi:hypothetical protein
MYARIAKARHPVKGKPNWRGRLTSVPFGKPEDAGPHRGAGLKTKKRVQMRIALTDS